MRVSTCSSALQSERAGNEMLCCDYSGQAPVACACTADGLLPKQFNT
jgi:hypothetical protein